MIENKKILILGMARSGYEVAKLLGKANNTIIITDQKDQNQEQIDELKALGITFIKSSEPENLLDETFDLLIKNPAVFPFHPCVKKAHDLNIAVVNEMEVAYHYINSPVKIIGVTGSNGKTTTVSLIYEVLKEANMPVKLGGNIGTPLSKIVLDLQANDILLLEISDHQLIDMYDFKTDISILTNLCPTHLDYHGSYEAYKKTKKKIFAHHTKDNIAIIIEHFEFDNYRVTQKGSQNRREQKRIDRLVKELAPTESSVYFHDKIHGHSSYQNYIQNVIRNFGEHYVRIGTYKRNLKDYGLINGTIDVKVIFFIEDTSPLGSMVVDQSVDRPSVRPICLGQCQEFCLFK